MHFPVHGHSHASSYYDILPRPLSCIMWWSSDPVPWSSPSVMPSKTPYTELPSRSGWDAERPSPASWISSAAKIYLFDNQKANWMSAACSGQKGVHLPQKNVQSSGIRTYPIQLELRIIWSNVHSNHGKGDAKHNGDHFDRLAVRRGCSAISQAWGAGPDKAKHYCSR